METLMKKRKKKENKINLLILKYYKLFIYKYIFIYLKYFKSINLNYKIIN